MSSSDMPKMTTSESNGEVSASIAETNRVRTLLGLKPLKVASSTSVSSTDKHKHQRRHDQDAQQTAQDTADQKSNNAIEKLFETLQQKHKSKHTTLRGISLTDELMETDQHENFDAAQWVQKSRQIEQQRQQQQVAMKKQQLFSDEEEDDDDADDAANNNNNNNSTRDSHLQHKIVQHSVDDFQSGQTAILILKDRRILDDRMAIDEHEDELINVALHEKEMRENKKAEHEFNTHGRKYNPFETDVDGNGDTLLPQYDERDFSKNKHSFQLNERGQVQASNEILSALEQQQQQQDGVNGNDGEKAKFTAYDLTEGGKIGTDYAIQFKKKKKKKEKRGRNEGTANGENDGVPPAKKTKTTPVPLELAQETLDAKYAFLDDGDNGGTQQSRKRRDDQVLHALKMADMEQEDERQRMHRYNVALYKANKSMADNLRLNEIMNAHAGNEDSDDDEIFQNTLTRAQKLQSKRASTEENVEQTSQDAAMMDVEQNVADVEVDDGEKGVLFTVATQFSDGLSHVMKELHEHRESHNNRSNTRALQEPYDIEHATIVYDARDHPHQKPSSTTAQGKDGGWVEYDEDDEDMDGSTKPAKQQPQKDTKTKGDGTGEAAAADGEGDGGAEDKDGLLDSSILDREPLCSRSLSDTISYMRRRGYDQEDEIEMDDKNNHKKPTNVGASKRKIEEVLKWDIDEVLQWLKKKDMKLYRKYEEQFRKKRIDGQQLVNSCGSSQFLRGVIGMKNGHLDISSFLSILGELKEDPAPDITLSYHDEHGKPMSAKEAFRKLSHKFHGKKSGPKKQEKRLKKQEQQLQRRKQNYVDTPLGTLEKLRQTTAALHKPFVVLDKKSTS